MVQFARHEETLLVQVVGIADNTEDAPDLDSGDGGCFARPCRDGLWYCQLPVATTHTNPNQYADADPDGHTHRNMYGHTHGNTNPHPDCYADGHADSYPRATPADRGPPSTADQPGPHTVD
jgi:hypothetical protein